MKSHRWTALFVALALSVSACGAVPTTEESSAPATLAPPSTTGDSDGDGNTTEPSESTTPEIASPSTTEPAKVTEPPEPVEPADDLLCTPIDPNTTLIYIDQEWEVGERRDVQVEFIGQTNYRGSRKTSSTLTPATISVESQDDAGATFLWQFGTTELLTGEFPADRPALGDAFPPSEVRYQLDADGRWVGMLGLPELRQSLISRLEPLRGTVPDANLTQAVSFLQELSDGHFETIVGGTQGAVHWFDGYLLDLDETYERDMMLTNLLGGPPFPSMVETTVLEKVDDDGCVVVKETSTPDPVEHHRILTETMELLNPGQPIDPEAFNYAQTSEKVIQFDAVAQRFRQITVVDKVVTSRGQALDRRIITDLTP